MGIDDAGLADHRQLGVHGRPGHPAVAVVEGVDLRHHEQLERGPGKPERQVLEPAEALDERALDQVGLDEHVRAGLVAALLELAGAVVGPALHDRAVAAAQQADRSSAVAGTATRSAGSATTAKVPSMSWASSAGSP